MRNLFSSCSHHGAAPVTRRSASEQPPGLILVQIDGLSRSRFEAGIADGSMPYLRSLLNRPSYQLHSMAPGMCCCQSCPLAVDSSTTPAADETTPGRPSLIRAKYTAEQSTRRPFLWTRLFDRRSSPADSLARIDKAIARIARRADRGSQHYDLWVHARNAFAILPVDAPLPRCCADEGAQLKPADLRATFEQFQHRLPKRIAAPRRPAGSHSKRILRVLSYDVHACLGLDGQWSPARIAQVIEHSGADVVCLQNLDIGRRADGVNQAKEIESLLQPPQHGPLQSHDGRTWNVKFDRYGNAVLSQFAMRLVRTGIATADDARTPRRSMLWVQVDVHGDTLVQFLNTHPIQNGHRLELPPTFSSSVEQWIEAAAVRGTTILCGEGTLDTESLAYRSIASHLVDSTSHALSRINHVFSTDDLSLQSAGIIATPLAKVASDHLPVQVGFWVA